MRKSPPPHLSGPSGPEGAPAASHRVSRPDCRTALRPHWRTLALFSLVILAASGWSGCERVSSGEDTGPSLTPEELPLRGETMLPDIGRPLPDIRIIPQGDHRGKSGMGQASDNQPGLHIDEVALRAYIETMADIFQEPHLSLFIVADSTGEFYSYGYRIIDFHPVEQELSGGQRELYIYVHPNEAGDGLYRMNVGLIPRSQSAFEDYQRWLLPEYYENGKPVFSPANARAKQ